MHRAHVQVLGTSTTTNPSWVRSFPEPADGCPLALAAQAPRESHHLGNGALEMRKVVKAFTTIYRRPVSLPFLHTESGVAR